jgi:hypothetical protein
MQEEENGFGVEKMTPEIRETIFSMLHPKPNLRPTTN